MSSGLKISKSEQEMYSAIQVMIDDQFNMELKKQLKAGNTKIDEAALRKKCADEVYDTLGELTQKMCIEMEKFEIQLKTDSPKLYEMLKADENKKRSDLERVKNVHELFDLSEHSTFEPDFLDKVYEIGERHYSSGKYEQAYLYMNWLCTADPKNPMIWFMKGVVEQNLQKYPDAIGSYYRSISLEPGYPHTYIQLMNCFVLMNNIEDAKQIYDVFTKEVRQADYEKDQFLVDNLNAIKEIVS